VNKRDKKTYLLIAPLPLPIGGVSVHSFRLAHWLLAQGYDCIVCNISKGSSINAGCQLERMGGIVFRMKSLSGIWGLLSKILNKPNLTINTHTKNVLLLLLVLLLKKIKRGSTLIVTVHSLRMEQRSKRHTFSAKLLAWICNSADGVIVTNGNIFRFLTDLGCDKKLITVSQTYLKPTNMEAQEDPGKKIRAFLSGKFPIITANAYQLTFYNGQDLYGLDLCVQLTEDLKNRGFDVGFVFALPEIGDTQYYEKIIDSINRKGLENNFFIRRDAIGLVSLLALSDFFLRPTNTDGDSISIREALDIGVPVIASDCVQRPPGVTLFKNRDPDDLLCKVLSLGVLSSKKDGNRRSSMIKHDNMPMYISALDAVEDKLL